jgi:ElaB/YqjD/DUF883 family membrane-anchored ribosome-binding protein
MINRKMSDYWNMGTAIGLCAAVGIVLGALLQNVVLWMCIGAGVGVVLGAVFVNKKPQDK